MCLKDVDRMANSVESDQTAPSNLSVRILVLRIMTVSSCTSLDRMIKKMELITVGNT